MMELTILLLVAVIVAGLTLAIWAWAGLVRRKRPKRTVEDEMRPPRHIGRV